MQMLVKARLLQGGIPIDLAYGKADRCEGLGISLLLCREDAQLR